MWKREPSRIVLAVAITLGASPEKRLPRLAPSSASKPSPLDSVFSRPARNWGRRRFGSLWPPGRTSERRGCCGCCPQDAGLAGGGLGGHVGSQPTRRWLPVSSQWARLGMIPWRTARSRTGWPAHRTPGTQTGLVGLFHLGSPLVAAVDHISVPGVVVVDGQQAAQDRGDGRQTQGQRIAQPRLSTWNPSTSALASRMNRAFITRVSKPRVSTIKGMMT